MCIITYIVYNVLLPLELIIIVFARYSLDEKFEKTRLSFYYFPENMENS